ncbi:MAG: PEGA domain-containing protein, partial [Myxococcales bacterium]|nr:PEGA domain-containing protein [Myxococcales bacterium]
RRWWLVPALAAAVIAAIVAIALGRGGAGRARPTPAATPAVTAPTPAPAPPTPPPAIVSPPAATTAPVEVVLLGDVPAPRIRFDGVDAAVAAGRAQVTLAPGRHELVVSARGHVEQRRTIEVIAGQAQRLELTLERARAGKPRGGARPGPVDDGEGVVDPFGDH